MRSLRVTKLRYLTKLVSHYLKRFVLRIKSDDLSAYEKEDFDEEGELNKFIVDSVIKFLSGIIIESTYFIAFDELADFRGFTNNEVTISMSYIDASYFTVVTFTTIGYGDIYPIKTVL